MEDITVQELKHKLEQKEDFILIDVREIYEHTDFNIGGELASLQTGLPYKIEELKNKSDQEIICLLYTSDAADERSSVDLGGRRIIKNKTTIKLCGRLISKK